MRSAGEETRTDRGSAAVKVPSVDGPLGCSRPRGLFSFQAIVPYFNPLERSKEWSIGSKLSSC